MTASATGSATATATNSGTAVSAVHSRLTGGQIAGIVVGAVLGALLLIGLIIAGCLLLRRRRDSSPATSVFNQPISTRHQAPVHYNDGAQDLSHPGMSVLAGGRVARMSALEGSSSSERGGAGYASAEGYRDYPSEDNTPESNRMLGSQLPKRSGSLSSGSHLAAAVAGAEIHDTTSPSSGAEQFTSPESAGQSERLALFKDYYSQDEIHASDLVSALWAYEPRAADEFHLERGDMIKVLGIWDDGWATGVRVRQKAEDWRKEEKVQRDSAMSGSGPSEASEEGEVKAFPLVCVCLPQHWRRTIEGDSTEGSGMGAYPELP